jgi:hypothetical protein
MLSTELDDARVASAIEWPWIGGDKPRLGDAALGNRAAAGIAAVKNDFIGSSWLNRDDSLGLVHTVEERRGVFRQKDLTFREYGVESACERVIHRNCPIIQER